MARQALLARTFVELADTLVADFDVVELLTLLADRCVEMLDVGAAGIMLVTPDGDLRVMASSSEAMAVLELFEQPGCGRTSQGCGGRGAFARHRCGVRCPARACAQPQPAPC